MTTKTTELATTSQEKSAISQFSQTDIDIIKNSVAKNTTDAELKYFLAVAQTNKLNPFNKEIWCYKASSDLLIFAGRDGFLANAQRQSDFNGVRSSAVFSKDTFTMDIPAGHVVHSFGVAERGDLVGAYAFCYRKGMQPFLVWVDIKTYDKGANTWKTHRAAMIEKTAEAHVLKKAYPLGAISVENDFDFDKGQFTGAPENVDTHYEIINETPSLPEEIRNAIDDANTLKDCVAIYDGNKDFHTNADFMTALGNRKQVIKKAGANVAK